MSKLMAGPVALALIVASLSVARADIRFSVSDCPVQADASFRIRGAGGELQGVAFEYAWLRKYRPGWRRDSQALLKKDGRYFDVLDISRGAARQAVCFDISDFYGRF